MKPRMHTDTHGFQTTGESLVAQLLKNLCASVCICGSFVWSWLRAVLEDDAYEQYVRRFPHRSLATGHRSRAAFYLARLQHKYSRPTRCC